MEMKSYDVTRTGNTWDRTLTSLPRIRLSRSKYAPAPRGCSRLDGVGAQEQAWCSCSVLEQRFQQGQPATPLWALCPSAPWLEDQDQVRTLWRDLGFLCACPKVYKSAVEFFGDEHMDEHLYVTFAEFEENLGEFKRVWIICKFTLARIPKH